MKVYIPVLYPLTDEAKRSINCGAIIMDKLPFRIGRQSRSNSNNGSGDESDRRINYSFPNNDCYMIDNGKYLNISREHLRVEQKKDGSYEIIDCGSTCGIHIDDHHIGGKSKSSRHPVRKGSIVVLGTTNSPYVFKFLLVSD